MNLTWPAAAVIIAALLFGFCAYSVRESTRSVDRGLERIEDALTYERCYGLGYEAALLEVESGEVPSPPEGAGTDCAGWFLAGLTDGRRAYEALDGAFP